MVIVRSYADQGKSGLSIDRRDALKQLLADIQDGLADFDTILVYDVRGWVRFQDADESACELFDAIDDVDAAATSKALFFTIGKSAQSCLFGTAASRLN
jgi:DNA invertase Pin-like site-specific DNA recombinase